MNKNTLNISIFMMLIFTSENSFADCSKEEIIKLNTLAHTSVREKTVYPRAARLHGWQGSGTIILLVKPDGSVINKKIIQSTGYTVLDNEMIEAISRTELPDLKCNEEDSRLKSITIPFYFLLEEPAKTENPDSNSSS